ncbi:MAG: class B sortase [Christensenella sp.]|uniref:class B sortase n=1 Tax=Christensenella sp. TaxID=1935934 RepID=UPI002B20B622|nr:class B sortase [Christensenella sp.]MEA5004498.1 class B sortase [Christensenella sp.]
MAKHSKKTKKGAWIWIGIVACICVMIYAGFQIYSETEEDNMGNGAYLSLKETITSIEPAGASAGSTATTGQRVDIPALKKISGDAVGWIYAEGTPIDYPVMQGEDNSFYLNHLYDGTKNRLGSIFLDYRNAQDFSDQNSILYGHHMKSGKMFAALEKYKEQSYYDGHPSLTLDTQNGSYRVELLAGYVVDGSVNDLQLNFGNGEEFLSFVETVKGKSTFRSDVAVQGTDRIVTMVTCTYDFQNARYALIGKLVSI